MKLIQGDCLQEMKNIPDGSVDLVLTDPPYGTTACKWDSVITFEPMWEQLKRVIKPNGAIVLMGSQPFTSALVMSNPKMFKYCWVWDKSLSVGHLVSKYRPMKRTEDICIFSNGACSFTKSGNKMSYFPIMEKRERIRKHKPSNSKSTLVNNHSLDPNYKREDYSFRFPTNILNIKNTNRSGLFHPTQKPVALMEYLIKTYTNEGETVLDFTMGSGTTGVACKNLNRDFIGIELDPEYFSIAKKRINDH
jgi:site-specific DNA-methyltransferase (adenine-specific)